MDLWCTFESAALASLSVFKTTLNVKLKKWGKNKPTRVSSMCSWMCRIGWDIMVVIALILTMVALPIEIAFFSVEEEGPHEGTHEGPHEGTEKDVRIATHRQTLAAAETGENASSTVQGLVHEGHIYEGINLFAEGIFVIDIVLNFRTGYVFKEMDQVQRMDDL